MTIGRWEGDDGRIYVEKQDVLECLEKSVVVLEQLEIIDENTMRIKICEFTAESGKEVDWAEKKVILKKI